MGMVDRTLRGPEMEGGGLGRRAERDPGLLPSPSLVPLPPAPHAGFWRFLFGCAMQHVGSSPTRDSTRVPCIGSAES